MNDYEVDIIKSMDAIGGDCIYIENGESEVFQKISEHYPAVGSKIDWNRFEGFVEEREWNLDLHGESFKRFFYEAVSRFGLTGDAIYVGDGLTDFSLYAPIDQFGLLLDAIFDVPHHHYFVSDDFSWCMCFTMEGDMNFAFCDPREAGAARSV
jgi:hypothetical protein